jgi:anaerobic selenocysteine-containing dehydrogenase
MRACGLLPAVTGNLGKPGAGFLYLNGFGERKLDLEYLVAPHLATNVPPSVSHMDLIDWLEDHTRSQALMCWNINPAASNPQQARLHAVLRREDLFTVVADLFATDTVAFADIVLPAASFLEFDDLVMAYFNLTLSAQVKVTDPPGEALSNMEIFRRLAGAMGYTEPELHENDATIIATLLKRMSSGETFASLAAKGTVFVSSEPAIQFADHTFPTPSGRIEIASARAEAAGHPRVPLPLVDPRPDAGRLRLLSPASPWLLNDSFANVEKIVTRIGSVTIAIHPLDAAERGLTEGRDIVLSNETGQLRAQVTLSTDVPRGVALSHKGRWPNRENSRANVNVLNPGRKADMGDSTAVHSIEVAISPAP